MRILQIFFPEIPSIIAFRIPPGIHPGIPPGILSQITPGIPAGIAPRILVMISSEISLGIFFFNLFSGCLLYSAPLPKLGPTHGFGEKSNFASRKFRVSTARTVIEIYLA